MAIKEDDLDLAETKPAKTGGLKKIILFSVLGLFLVGGTVAGTIVFLKAGTDKSQVDDEDEEESDDDSDKKKKKKKKKKKATEDEEAAVDDKKDGKKSKAKNKAKEKEEAQKRLAKTPVYFELDKPIVVNLDGTGGAKFLQINVALMAYSEATIEKIKAHLPLIRHHLVLLFSSQSFAELQTVDGKKKLQEKTLTTIRDELKKMTGDPLVEAVYLPSIVGQ